MKGERHLPFGGGLFSDFGVLGDHVGVLGEWSVQRESIRESWRERDARGGEEVTVVTKALKDNRLRYVAEKKQGREPARRVSSAPGRIGQGKDRSPLPVLGGKTPPGRLKGIPLVRKSGGEARESEDLSY